MTDRIDAPSEITVYGWTASDILKVQNWLMSQNVTIKDLDGASIRLHYWQKQKVADMVLEDSNDR